MADAKRAARTSEVVCTRLQVGAELDDVKLGAEIMAQSISQFLRSASVAMARAVIEAAADAGIGRGEGSWENSWIEKPTLTPKQP